MSRTIGCWLALIVLTSPAFARDLYVSNLRGDDQFDGRNPRTIAAGRGPVRSLSRALQLAGPSDVIQLENTGTPYRESVTLFGPQHSGHRDAPFVILGNEATLDGSTVVLAEAWDHHRGKVFRYAPRRLTWQQLFLEGVPLVRRPGAPSQAELERLEPLEWMLGPGHIYFRPEAGRLPDVYDLSCTDQNVGITLLRVDHVRIVDLTVEGFHLDGIHCGNAARDVTLAGVICRGNGRSGVAAVATSRVTLTSSLLGENGEAELFVDQLAKVTLEETELLGTAAPKILRRGGEVVGGEN